MINRLDSICQAVLKGKWPGVRRAYEGNAVTSFYTTKLLDNTTTLTEDPSASPQGSKVKKHVADREKEFSVKINDVCYFTFSPTNADLQCHCSAWHVLFVFIVWSSPLSSSICLFLSSFHLILLWKFCSFSLILVYILSVLLSASVWRPTVYSCDSCWDQIKSATLKLQHSHI